MTREVGTDRFIIVHQNSLHLDAGTTLTCILTLCVRVCQNNGRVEEKRF